MALVTTVVVQRGHAVNPLRVLVLTRYGALGASSRLRFMQYFPAFEAVGMEVQWKPLFDDSALRARYKRGHYGVSVVLAAFCTRMQVMLHRRDFDLIWIEKEALPYSPVWLESALLFGVPYVLDYDDAVFHNYDNHNILAVRWLLGARLDRLMARAALVVCGNKYLADRAVRAGAPWVEVLPTVIDLERYTSIRNFTQSADSLPRIIWIGSPSTARYLEILREPLQSLSSRVPFVLRVIGANVDFPGVNVECVRWTEATEVANIVEGNVGVMPLLDSAWERGKCGYKLIQYMACGLPVIASPVGVNTEIVEDGVNGFLVTKAEDWVVALKQLLTNAELCTRMGHEGRKRVESEYCLQVTGQRNIELLNKSAERSA